MKRLITLLIAAMALVAVPSLAYAIDSGSTSQEGDISSSSSSTGEKKDAEKQSGTWTTIAGSKAYHFKDGTYAKGLTEIEGSTYFFDDDFTLLTGWKKIDGSKYYFKSTGVMATGLIKIKKNKYYFSSKGKMSTGLKKIDGKTYYFQSDGKMLINDRKFVSGKLYYFDKKGEVSRTIDSKKPMVALTYDDGPSPNTATILNTLKKYKGVATFFVVGNRVSSYKKTLKKVYSMGCEIGNHTYSHKILTSASSAVIKSQIKKTNNAIKKITGSKAVIMRPPGGSHNATVRKSVGAPLILWSIDTRDWEHRNSSRTISSVIGHVKDGSIVLMHDLYAPTATASKTIIPKLAKKYQLVTVSELGICRGGLKSGKIYYSLRR